MAEYLLIALLKYLSAAVVLVAALIYFRKAGPWKKVILPVLMAGATFLLMEKVVAPAMWESVAERSRSIRLM
jgi:hypothetical protein